MDFIDYQREANKTAVYHESPLIGQHHGILYTALGLNGEAGEVADLTKKYFRDQGSLPEFKQAMTKELGDVLWYIAMCASELDIPLELVALANVNKLKDRKERGVIGGSGNER